MTQRSVDKRFPVQGEKDGRGITPGALEAVDDAVLMSFFKRLHPAAQIAQGSNLHFGHLGAKNEIPHQAPINRICDMIERGALGKILFDGGPLQVHSETLLHMADTGRGFFVHYFGSDGLDRSQWSQKIG